MMPTHGAPLLARLDPRAAHEVIMSIIKRDDVERDRFVPAAQNILIYQSDGLGLLSVTGPERHTLGKVSGQSTTQIGIRYTRLAFILTVTLMLNIVTDAVFAQNIIRIAMADRRLEL